MVEPKQSGEMLILDSSNFAIDCDKTALATCTDPHDPPVLECVAWVTK